MLLQVTGLGHDDTPQIRLTRTQSLCPLLDDTNRNLVTITNVIHTTSRQENQTFVENDKTQALSTFQANQ